VQAVSNIYCSGVIIALQNVAAGNVFSSGNVSAQYLQATNGLISAGTIQSTGAIVAGTTSGAQQFQATNSLQSSGTVQASGAITAGTTSGAQQFQATNSLQSSGTVQASGAITAGTVVSGQQFQATNTITGGSFVTAGNIQAAQHVGSNVQVANVATQSIVVYGAISATQYQGITAGPTQVNNLGGGTITSAVTVQGAVNATGDVIAYYQVSDDRLKNRVGNIQEALEKVNKINGFTFTFNDEARTHGFDDRLHVGVSAQELEQVLPEVVRPFSFENSESKFKRVEYEKIIPLLVESIKELTTRVEQLEDLTKSLKTE
jgi:hypothetical protein